MSVELDWIEAQAATEVGAALRALWADPSSRVLADPPVLRAPATLAALARARGADERAEPLWRMALGVAARTAASAERNEAGLRAAATARNARARALGFADAWALARVVAGEPDEALAPVDAPDVVPEVAEDPAFERVLAAPERLVAAVGGGARVIRVAVLVGDASTAGRTFVIEPGRDVRVRVTRRPGASARGAVRVLLHELGHATLAASFAGRSWALAQPASHADDEAAAARAVRRLEDAAFLRDVIGCAAPDEIAAAERALRRRRHARLVATATAERAMYRDDGPPPWEASLPWTDPGGSHSYALAESLAG